MRTFIILLLLLGFSKALFAQNTLEFNQVKLVSDLETVPEQKVWKVESAFPSVSQDFHPHYILVNGAPVYLSEFNTGDTYWSRIESIELDLRKTTTTACANSNTFVLAMSGFENDFPFSVSRSADRSKDAISTTFENIITFSPQTSGAILELTSIELRVSAQNWRPFELRLKVNYIDGFSQSYLYSSSTSNFCGSGGATYYIGSASGPFLVPYRAKETFHYSAKLPLWLPPGATLETGHNIGAISVIEFTAGE